MTFGFKGLSKYPGFKNQILYFQEKDVFLERAVYLDYLLYLLYLDGTYDVN